MVNDYQVRKDIDDLRMLVSNMSEGDVVSKEDLEEYLSAYPSHEEVVNIVRDYNNYDELKILAVGLGYFTIVGNNLQVEMAVNVSNTFSIDNSGHLNVTLSGDNPYSINSDGHLIYNDGE